MRFLLRKVQSFSNIFNISKNGVLQVPVSSMFVAPKACYNIQTNSYENYNVNYADAMMTNQGDFAFKSSPEDIRNDLVKQLDVSEVVFTLPSNHIYQIIKKSPNDNIDTDSVLKRLEDWNPHFHYFVRISFQMRILISRLDQFYALHITEMQLLADNVIQTIPNRKGTMERTVRHILAGLEISDKIDVDLHRLCERTADLITNYKLYETQYIVNWILLYLDNAVQFMNMSKDDRPIDDQLLYRNGAPPIPPYIIHLATISALNLEYPEKKYRDNFQRLTNHYNRDLLGYLYCYINLLADDREDLHQRTTFAASMMKVRLHFFTEEKQEEGETPKRYSRDEYYECMNVLTTFLPRLPLLDKIPNANLLYNQIIARLQKFSFQEYRKND